MAWRMKQLPSWTALAKSISLSRKVPTSSCCAQNVSAFDVFGFTPLETRASNTNLQPWRIDFYMRASDLFSMFFHFAEKVVDAVGFDAKLANFCSKKRAEALAECKTHTDWIHDRTISTF